MQGEKKENQDVLVTKRNLGTVVQNIQKSTEQNAKDQKAIVEHLNGNYPAYVSRTNSTPPPSS